MGTQYEEQEAEMVRVGIPPERAAAETFVVDALDQATLDDAALRDAAVEADSVLDFDRRRARAHLIGALLLGSVAGLSARDLHAEFLAAFGECFNDDGTLRDLMGAYGYAGGVGFGG